MIGLLFSSREEAQDFLQGYERGRFGDLAEGDVVEDGMIAVSITGTGKVKAALRTERFLQALPIERLIHAGLCSALRQDVPAESIVGIDQVFEGDRIELAAPTYPRMPLALVEDSLDTGVLVTQDHIPTGEREQTYWQRLADFVDSSGYPIAYVAATHGVRTSIIKAVTGMMADSQSSVRQIRASSEEALARYLLGVIPKLTDND